jgi:serine/threonine protein phosphatase PrpC
MSEPVGCVDDTGDHDALTAWLGADAGEPEPRVRSYRPPGPGRLLLCTDGLWRYLPDAASFQAGTARGRTNGPDLLKDARSLVEYALDAGGHDNITALLIPVPGVPRS